MTTTQILYPPLAAITPTDQRGVLWIIGIICLAFIYLTLALRVFVRWRRFQPDDYAIIAACVLVVAEASVAFAAVGLGLGSSKLNGESSRESTVWRLFIASEAIFVIATFTAKAAVLLTVEKLLARDMRERTIFQYTLVAVGVLGLASVLTVTIDCAGQTCNQQPRWIAVALMDSVSEIWGFSLFCWVVFSLQMKFTFKFTSAAILGLRLFCVAFAGVHAYYVSIYEQADDPAVNVITPLSWQQLALTWSLLSAMAVALRPFIREMHTGMGMDLANVGEGSYARSKKYTNNEYKMQELSKNSNRQVKVAQENDSSESNPYRADDIHYSAAIYHEDRKPSSASARSQEPMIRREVEYTVTYQAQD
ncbi:hypothetical protein M409DRAFT_70826 [Zasmidium cellare ATCC 36951]|uniref:Rhodopsin domain-containing protein n=1 Tax=Zasmidium cellare ATCC 36951 TaxID=1080233 RepID=A0A6A6BYB7_ZASCE|nr:uncharacterized protein M409DRAFT_70826 [Zasmidium cellare ATCC 36951]KAF2159781.1 hypothetical protein M409DRAFT_70826 [Zasmidium cellare ATCC 36951]